MPGPPRKIRRVQKEKDIPGPSQPQNDLGTGSKTINTGPVTIIPSLTIPSQFINTCKVFENFPNNLREKVRLCHISTTSLGKLARTKGAENEIDLQKLSGPIILQTGPVNAKNGHDIKDEKIGNGVGVATSSSGPNPSENLVAVVVTSDDTVYSIEKQKCNKIDELCGKQVKELFAIPRIEEEGCSWFALTDSGDLFAWGFNKFGNLGLGHCKTVTNPVLVATKPKNFVPTQIVGGSHFTLALDEEGNLYWWRGWLECETLKTTKSKWKQINPVLDNQKIHHISACGNKVVAVTKEQGWVYEWVVKCSKEEGSVNFVQCRPNQFLPIPRVMRCSEPIRKAICSLSNTIYLTTRGLVFLGGHNIPKCIGPFVPPPIRLGRLFDIMDIATVNDFVVAIVRGGLVFALEDGSANIKAKAEMTINPVMLKGSSLQQVLTTEFGILVECLKGSVLNQTSGNDFLTVENALSVYASTKNSNMQELQDKTLKFIVQNSSTFTEEQLKQSGLTRDDLADLCAKLLSKCTGTNSSTCTQLLDDGLFINSQ